MRWFRHSIGSSLKKVSFFHRIIALLVLVVTTILGCSNYTISSNVPSHSPIERAGLLTTRGDYNAIVNRSGFSFRPGLIWAWALDTELDLVKDNRFALIAWAWGTQFPVDAYFYLKPPEGNEFLLCVNRKIPGWKSNNPELSSDISSYYSKKYCDQRINISSNSLGRWRYRITDGTQPIAFGSFAVRFPDLLATKRRNAPLSNIELIRTLSILGDLGKWRTLHTYWKDPNPAVRWYSLKQLRKIDLNNLSAVKMVGNLLQNLPENSKVFATWHLLFHHTSRSSYPLNKYTTQTMQILLRRSITPLITGEVNERLPLHGPSLTAKLTVSSKGKADVLLRNAIHRIIPNVNEIAEYPILSALPKRLLQIPKKGGSPFSSLGMIKNSMEKLHTAALAIEAGADDTSGYFHFAQLLRAGRRWLKVGEYNRADQLLLQVQKWSKTNNHTDLELLARIERGNILLAKGEYTFALEMFKRAGEYAFESKALKEAIESWMGAGDVGLLIRDTSLARKYYARALQLIKNNLRINS